MEKRLINSILNRAVHLLDEVYDLVEVCDEHTTGDNKTYLNMSLSALWVLNDIMTGNKDFFIEHLSHEQIKKFEEILESIKPYMDKMNALADQIEKDLKA